MRRYAFTIFGAFVILGLLWILRDETTRVQAVVISPPEVTQIVWRPKDAVGLTIERATKDSRFLLRSTDGRALLLNSSGRQLVDRLETLQAKREVEASGRLLELGVLKLSGTTVTEWKIMKGGFGGASVVASKQPSGPDYVIDGQILAMLKRPVKALTYEPVTTCTLDEVQAIHFEFLDAQRMGIDTSEWPTTARESNKNLTAVELRLLRMLWKQIPLIESVEAASPPSSTAKPNLNLQITGRDCPDQTLAIYSASMHGGTFGIQDAFTNKMEVRKATGPNVAATVSLSRQLLRELRE